MQNWVYLLDDYIIDIDISNQKQVDYLSNEIKEVLYKYNLVEIPVVIDNKIVAVIGKQDTRPVEYKWDIIEKDVIATFFSKWKNVYMSSLEHDNLIALYTYMEPQISVQLINDENLGRLFEDNDDAVFIYGSNIYSDQVKITCFDCEQLAQKLFNLEIEKLKNRARLCDEWGELEETDVCLKNIIQLLDKGYRTVNIIDKKGLFQSAICRHMVKERFLYKQIPRWSNLFVNDCGDQEQTLEELAKVFIGTKREEVAILRDGKIVASGVGAKEVWNTRFNPQFVLRWELISDKTAYDLFNYIRQDTGRTVRILISSECGNLSGFKERFSALFDITVFTEDEFDRYLSGYYDWLIYGSDVWCDTGVKSISVEQIYLDLISKEAVDWLESNNIDYYYFEAPDDHRLWDISRRWSYAWLRPEDVLDKNGYLVLTDRQMEGFNVCQGNRIVKGTPLTFEQTIYFFGPCIAVGSYAKDDETIESFLQKKLNADGHKYRVVNCGSVNSAINSFYRMLDTNFRPGDIVVHIGKTTWKNVLTANLKYYYECSWIFNIAGNCSKNCFVKGDPMHLDKSGNKIMADYIYTKLQDRLNREVIDRNREIIRSPYSYNLNNKELEAYLKKLEGFRTSHENVGAIVMNCNPFTLGHRYLVELGSRLTEYLYVFIVEEDKSEFSFAERFEMAEQCCAHFNNVKVLPSGKYIISGLTFGDYFVKDKLQDKVVVPTMDVEMFGRYIAPTLNIKTRLVGEEPLDRVTAQYNKLMKENLPGYGVRVVEVPRCMIQDNIISASQVRRLIKKGEWTEVQRYLPEETYDMILKSRGKGLRGGSHS